MRELGGLTGRAPVLRALPLAAAALLAAAPLPAQAPTGTLPAERPAPGRRSPLLAGAAEYLVPTLGHAYAGD